MTTNPTIQRVKDVLYGSAYILFPIMLMIGFLMHPNLLAFELTTTAAQLADKFHHNALFHIGHLVVTFAVPLIIAMHLGLMERLRGRGAWYGFIGGIIGIFGAFILAVDKGSLCLVLSAFDALPEDQFATLVPSLQVIVDMDGLLWVNRLLALLSLGGILQAVGLVRERHLATWQGVAMVIGLLVQINPGFDLINAVGVGLMMLGFFPLGVQTLRGALSRR